MEKGIGTYRKTAINTASKEEILLMLYQAAIRACKKSIQAIEAGELKIKSEQIAKLQDIIAELNHGLNHDVGGKIAGDLASLYDYILYSSTQANIKLDPEPLKGCLNVLSTLYEGWVEAVKMIKSQNISSAEREAGKESVGKSINKDL